jgi:hypothetical protein
MPTGNRLSFELSRFQAWTALAGKPGKTMPQATASRIEVHEMNTNGTNGNARIELLKKREAEIRAKIAAEQIKKRRRIEKENARLFALVGEALCQNAADNPETFGLMLKQVLASTVTDDRTREFLSSKGMI